MRRRAIQDLVIVIGGGGIGSVTAKHLASRGAILVVTGRRNGQTAEFLHELRSLSPRSTWIEADLRGFDAWSTLFDAVQREFHRIDVLVNTVGKLIPGPFDSLTPSQIEEMVGSNILGVVHGTRAVLPFMRARRKGTIINIGSLGGIVPMPFESLYSATKFAVRGFSLSMYEEMRGSGIDICLLSPSSVRTKMLDLQSSDDRSAISFVQKPMEPLAAARAVERLIKHPRREVILPACSAMPARVVSLFPALFGLSYPALRGIGVRNVKKYRQVYSINDVKHMNDYHRE